MLQKLLLVVGKAVEEQFLAAANQLPGHWGRIEWVGGADHPRPPSLHCKHQPANPIQASSEPPLLERSVSSLPPISTQIPNCTY